MTILPLATFSTQGMIRECLPTRKGRPRKLAMKKSLLKDVTLKEDGGRWSNSPRAQKESMSRRGERVLRKTP